MFKVLIVCTANICRSPLGEAILKKLVKKEGLLSLIRVESCGTWGLEGEKPCKLSEQVALENDLDIFQHRARQITPEIAAQADLILCMTPDHKQDLIHLFPSKEKIIFTLKEFASKSKPADQVIADPIGLSLNFYRRIFREIEVEMKRIFPVLKKLAEKKR